MLFIYSNYWEERQELCEVKSIENFVVSYEINGDYNLSFDMLANDRCAPYIDVKNYIYVSLDKRIEKGYEFNLQWFRITAVTRDKTTLKVVAKHIIHDGAQSFVPKFDEHIGRYSGEIFADIWADSNFYVMSEQDIINDHLSMTPCEVFTDFEKQDKQSRKDLTDLLMQNINQGELYIDNNNIALVDEIGVDYPELELAECKNLESLTIDEDSDGLITRLYAYGKDSLDLTATDIGAEYIDSPYIDIYGVREGYYEWSGISDPERLQAQAEWLFDPVNQNRIDVPRVSITGKITDLAGRGENDIEYHIGQRVRLPQYSDEQFRIIKIDWHPLRPFETEITIGKVKKDLFYYFKYFNNTETRIYQNIGKRIGASGNIYNTIVEVTKEEVLASDVIEAGSVFSQDIFTERLETNLVSYKCIPNLTANGSNITWDDDPHTYSCLNTETIRGYIKAEGINLQFIESHLVKCSDYSNIPLNAVEPLQINGKQVYYTSIQGSKNAYQYFTFATPQDKKPDISADNAEMFKVYVRKQEAEYVKAAYNFELENGTYNVILRFGVGDGTGRGIYQFLKNGEMGELSYIGREDGLKYGIRMSDKGLELLNGKNDTTFVPPTHFVDTAEEAEGQPEGHLVYIKE